ncbi:hypothetical protein ZHAS_00007017 [Anopheles sinensis]|uniref:Uncharacterized protein n=1 Tax=Anopheles sinensis TaxID=74873 RepID=A0A084VNM5_ANOSI|nr:hypothetical protein ZHAS_00007017 [Anopheles sinensis]
MLPEFFSKAEAFKSVCDLRAIELRDDEHNIVSYYQHCEDSISQPSVKEEAHPTVQSTMEEDDDVIIIEDTEDPFKESPMTMEPSVDEVENHTVQHAVEEDDDVIIIEDEDSLEISSIPKEPSNTGTADAVFHPAFHFNEETYALCENLAKLTEVSDNEVTSSIDQPEIDPDQNVFILEETEHAEEPSNAGTEDNIVHEVEADHGDIFVQYTENTQQPTNTGTENNIVQPAVDNVEGNGALWYNYLQNLGPIDGETSIIILREIDPDDGVFMVEDTECVEKPSITRVENDRVQSAVDLAEDSYVESSKMTESCINVPTSYTVLSADGQTDDNILIEYTDNFRAESPIIKQESIGVKTECVASPAIEVDDDDDDDDVIYVEVVENPMEESSPAIKQDEDVHQEFVDNPIEESPPTIEECDDLLQIEFVDNHPIEESPTVSAMLTNASDPLKKYRKYVGPMWDKITVPVLKLRPNNNRVGVGAARRKQPMESICQYVPTDWAQMNKLVCLSSPPEVIHFPPRHGTINAEGVAKIVRKAPAATRKVSKPRAKKNNATGQRRTYTRRIRQ